MSVTAAGLCVTADGVVLDGVAAPVLSRVLDVTADLFTELNALDPTVVPPCAVMVVSGAAAALDRGLTEDGGCCGQLWTRLVELYPSSGFPAPDTLPHREDLSWAVVLELGIVRPAPLLGEDAGTVTVPSVAEEQEAASVATVDGAILREALLNRYAQAEDVAIVLGVWTPFGPDGGIVGGVLTATIQVV